jgi:hypothetical protein
VHQPCWVSADARLSEIARKLNLFRAPESLATHPLCAERCHLVSETAFSAESVNRWPLLHLLVAAAVLGEAVGLQAALLVLALLLPASVLSVIFSPLSGLRTLPELAHGPAIV